MSLPIGSKKIIGVVLLFSFLFLVSPVPILASHNSDTSTGVDNNTQTPTGNYQIVPLPSPSNNTPITPIPTPKNSPSIQQAGFFEDLGGGLKKLGGKIVGLAGDVANEAIGAALYIIENALVLQIGGEVVSEAVGLIADGDTQGVQQLLADLKNSPNPGDGGLIGVAGSTTDTLVAMPLPISSGEYFASINPFKSAQAQQIGEGQQGLTGPENIILDLWKKVRNVSYILAVVALIIIGFLIMLRIPLGPRTVVSAQNSLPRIALALFLITFSFAISGLLIDLTRMAAKILNALVTVPWEGIWHAILGTMIVTMLIGEITGGLGGIVILAIALILALVILIGLLIIIYKLLTRYVIFILLTIFAPFFFLFGALPGMEGFIFTWFKRAAASLLAIPVTGLVLNLAFAIGFSGFGKVPVVSLNLLGGDLGQAFYWLALAPLIGFGLFFFATKVPDIVDEAFNIRPLPRGGIGSGAIIGAPLGLMMAGGNLARGAQGVRGIAAEYAVRGGGVTSFLGGQALRLPLIGNPTIREQVAQRRLVNNNADEEGPVDEEPRGDQGRPRGQRQQPVSWEEANRIAVEERRRREENERMVEGRRRSEEETDTPNY